MTYKCVQEGCKYTSDKPGECCNKDLVKSGDKGGCGSGCSCC